MAIDTETFNELDNQFLIKEEQQQSGGQLGISDVGFSEADNIFKRKEDDTVLKAIGSGLSNLFGLPGDIDSLIGNTAKMIPGVQPMRDFLGISDDDFGVNLPPTSEQLKSYANKLGFAPEPGVHPDSFKFRAVELASFMVPTMFLGGLPAYIKTGREIGVFGGLLGAEEIMRNIDTEFTRNHPVMSMAVAQLLAGFGGGFGASYLLRGGGIGNIYRGGKKILQSIFEPKKRAAKRFGQFEPLPEKGLRRLKTPDDILTPAQRAGTPGVQKLVKTIEKEEPKIALKMQRQREKATRELERQFKKTGDINDAKIYLEAEFRKNIDDAERALTKIEPFQNEDIIATVISEKLFKSYKSMRVAEKRVWGDIVDDFAVDAESTVSALFDILKDVRLQARSLSIIPKGISTRVGRIKNKKALTASIKNIFGILNKELDDVGSEFKLKPGTLFMKDPETKELVTSGLRLHALYSDLGEAASILARKGGSRNKLRIINEFRAALLDDIKNSTAGEQITDAIDFSLNLNNRFTKGAVGQIMGFKGGERLSPMRMVQKLVKGTTDMTASEAITQALKASPDTKNDITNFLKIQFAAFVKDRKTNLIDRRLGNLFIKRNEDILDLKEFVSLKSMFQNAIDKQSMVDDILKGTKVSNISPVTSEKITLAIFMNEDPAIFVSKLIRNKNLPKKKILTDLVRDLSLDPSGKSIQGLKHTISQEMIDFATVPDGGYISGMKLIKKLVEFRESLILSKLFSRKEYLDMFRVARKLKAIEGEIIATGFTGELLHNVPNRIYRFPVEFLAIKIGAKLSNQSLGSSLKIANTASAISREMLVGLTNDEARNLLVRAPFDEEILKMLFTDISKLNTSGKLEIMNKLKDMARQLASFVKAEVVAGISPTPAVVATSTATREENKILTRNRRLQLSQ